MSAQIHSVDSLADFQAALDSFREKAGEAMVSLEMEIRRTESWLAEQFAHWKSQIRKAEEAVVKAKSELARKKMLKIGDRPPDTTYEEKALARAKARLVYVEEKKDTTQHWIRQFPHDLQNYESAARPFQSVLEIDLPRMIAYLENKRASLEAYLRTGPPIGNGKGASS